MTGRTVGAGTSITLSALFVITTQKAGIRNRSALHMDHMLRIHPLIRSGEIAGHHTLQRRQPQRQGEQNGQQLAGETLHR